MKDKIRIHNSQERNLVVRNKAQIEIGQLHYGFKPIGLWYSVGNEWLGWCKENMSGWIYPYNYILKLDMAKMLLLTNSGQVNWFNNKYKIYPYDEIKSIHYIDWERVALKYGGIEINPYLWEMRLSISSLWYSAWDCASGCVWNKGVILSCVL